MRPDRLTGERPRQGVTPDSLLALHDAGYGAVAERLGTGTVLDVGCGEGFETVRLAGPGRRLIGVDYDAAALRAAAAAGPSLVVGQMDASSLALADGSVHWACSSHVIEHFSDPEPHVAELSRVLAGDGTVFLLTPNAPADFENPFHVHPFAPGDLEALLSRWFDDVQVSGLDATPAVKADFAARRARARRVLAIDVFGLRHRLPRRLYVAAYRRLLPLAYRVLNRHGVDGATGITAADWFVTDRVDDTTLVLFAVCRGPRPGGRRAEAGAARPATKGA